MPTKICKLCLIEKEINEFYKHKPMTDWHLSFCKDCKRSYARSNRSKERDREKYWTSRKRRLNVIYRWMVSRCYNKNNTHYKRYWEKWVKVLWSSYKEFYRDMSESYMQHRSENWKNNNRQTQIDRIDNNWNYCKENCRRVTARENNPSNKKILQ